MPIFIIKYFYDNNIKILYVFLILIFGLTFGKIFIKQGFNIFAFINGSTLKTYYNNSNLFPFVYFILGGLILKYKEKLKHKKITIISILIVLISMLSLTIYGYLVTNNTNKYFDIVWNELETIPILISTISIFILAMNHKLDINNNLIITIGQNTLGIYLIHTIFIRIGQSLFLNIGFVGNELINFILSFFIIGISLIIVLIFKKIPIANKMILA
jgi:surface polysaccharide O-acyltransferase-like enzyme